MCDRVEFIDLTVDFKNDQERTKLLRNDRTHLCAIVDFSSYTQYMAIVRGLQLVFIHNLYVLDCHIYNSSVTMLLSLLALFDKVNLW